MTEFEEKLLDEIEQLKARINRLESGSNVDYFESLPGDAIVGYDYFSYKTGISVRAIRQREQGTAAVKLVSNNPKKWRKSDIDSWQKKRLENPKQRALKEFYGKRKRSVLNKSL